jgi:adenylate kinase family enzyme
MATNDNVMFHFVQHLNADQSNSLPIAESSHYQARRINVVGTTGSGKTTTARQTACRLRLPHVELDALHWDPNWTEAPLAIFRERIAQALAGDAWVVDGNYSKARDLIWSRVELVVWLDYPLAVIMRQLVWRTLRRTLLREELWNGNRERFRDALFACDSILWWALTTHRRRRAQYQALFAQPAYAGLAVVRLPSPRATRDWLARLPAASAS